MFLNAGLHSYKIAPVSPLVNQVACHGRTADIPASMLIYGSALNFSVMFSAMVGLSTDR